MENEDHEDDFEAEELDIVKIEKNIHTYKSETICEMIVCNRYFNIYKDLTLICMAELAKRRIDGDTFNFEQFIENSLSELPKISLSIPDLGSLFGAK